MRRVRTSRLVAGTLLLVLGVMSMGLPSHHHDGPLDGRAGMEDANHHGHGVLLMEQSSHLPSLVGVAAIPARMIVLDGTPILTVPATNTPVYELPGERSPPSSSPRAPPVPT